MSKESVLGFQFRYYKLMIGESIGGKAEFVVPEAKQRQHFRSTHLKPLKASAEQVIGNNDAKD